MNDMRVGTGKILSVMGAGAMVLAVAGALAMGGTTLRAQGQAPAGGAAAAPPVQVPPTTHLEVGDGTVANYRATEQFVGVSFFSDAVGESSAVTGTMTVNPDGSIAPGAKFSFDLKSMKSNEDLRDNYVRTRTLEVDKFPTADFVPKSISGIPHPIPGMGASGFQLTGDLTIHGVTKEVTWNGISTFSPNLLSGRASTDINFDQFGLTKPKIGRLVAVGDKLTLEMVFKMKRS